MNDTANNAALLRLHKESVRPEWIDYNGHMNVGFYVLAFDHATDTFLEHVGLGEDYRKRAQASTFVVEAHVTYQQEVTEGTKLLFTTQLLGVDAKRLHLFHRMLKADDESLVATTEVMILHIDLGTRRTAPFPADAEARLAAVAAAQAVLARPAEAGRVMRIPAPK